MRYSLHAALLFLIVSSPFVYRLVQGLVGAVFTVAAPSGCPTLAGLVLHAAVFGALVYFLMGMRY